MRAVNSELDADGKRELEMTLLKAAKTPGRTPPAEAE